jgi:hypothetical protein
LQRVIPICDELAVLLEEFEIGAVGLGELEVGHVLFQVEPGMIDVHQDLSLLKLFSFSVGLQVVNATGAKKLA